MPKAIRVMTSKTSRVAERGEDQVALIPINKHHKLCKIAKGTWLGAILA
jgi:hypothetical protein